MTLEEFRMSMIMNYPHPKGYEIYSPYLYKCKTIENIGNFVQTSISENTMKG